MIVSGKIQEVIFRYRVKCIADELMLKGEVENMRDGTVRIACEGEEDIIEEFTARIRGMKRPVRVDDIRARHLGHASAYDGFTVMLGDEKEEELAVKMAAVTALMEINDKQDQTIWEIRASADKITGKQGQMLEKQGQMLEKQGQMLEKQDQMLEKQDQTIWEIRASADKITGKQGQTTAEVRNLTYALAATNSRIEKLENEVAEIREKISA